MDAEARGGGESQKSFPRHDVFAKSPMKSISTVVRKAAVETRVIKIDRRFLKVRVRPARFRRHLVGFETPLTSPSARAG